VPGAARDAVWRRICALAPPAAFAEAESGGSPAKPVCCYALQGICRFGASSCEYSHDVAAVQFVGCQFGSKCRLGHVALAELGPREAPEDRDADLLDIGFLDSFQTSGGLSCMECRGPSFDDSDPLWDEVACALRGDYEDEDVGDSDLSVAARRRLAAAGQYRLVNDDTADEWICVPAEELRDKLETVREKVTQTRRFWLGDDLSTVRHTWNEVLASLRPPAANGSFPSAKVPVADGALHRAAALADSALQRVLALQPQDNGNASQNLLNALAVAQGAVSGLQRAAGDAAGRRLADLAFYGTESPDSQLSEEARAKLVEMERSLERCIFVVRADDLRSGETPTWEAERGADGGYHGRALASQLGPPVAELAVGGCVEVVGLLSDAEQGLNGQEGQLERYDEALGVWQLRLAASGTRLLLGEEHLAGPRGRTSSDITASVLPRGRSRSPRRQSGAWSLLELVRDSAKNGEHILVHHIVAWYGNDAKPYPS